MSERQPITGSLNTGHPGIPFRLAGASPEQITPEQCVAQGGHCHDRTGMARPSLPPQYEERCRHCGHVRWAIPREPFEYREEVDR